ncbi:uncharacterized protein LOC144578234 [Callithrix jacchus]
MGHCGRQERRILGRVLGALALVLAAGWGAVASANAAVSQSAEEMLKARGQCKSKENALLLPISSTTASAVLPVEQPPRQSSMWTGSPGPLCALCCRRRLCQSSSCRQQEPRTGRGAGTRGHCLPPRPAGRFFSGGGSRCCC